MTSRPLGDTWHSRDLPVLREVVRLLDESVGRPVGPGTVRDNLGIGADDLQRAAVALASAGLVDTEGSLRRVGVFTAVSGEARRLAGSWPSPDTALDRMVSALEDLAANHPDEDTRSRAQKVRDGLLSGGNKIGVAVAAAAITGQLPGQ